MSPVERPATWVNLTTHPVSQQILHERIIFIEFRSYMIGLDERFGRRGRVGSQVSTMLMRRRVEVVCRGLSGKHIYKFNYVVDAGCEEA